MKNFLKRNGQNMKLPKSGEMYIKDNSDLLVKIEKIYHYTKDNFFARLSIYNNNNGIFYQTGDFEIKFIRYQDWKLIDIN